MKKEQIWRSVKLFAAPALLCLSGLILLVSPDTASALVGKLLGWLLMLGGLFFAVAAFGHHDRLAYSAVSALVLLALGSWLLRHPLALASGLGRLMGLVLLVQGGRDLFASQTTGGRVLAALTAALGLVLLLLPMTTSRLVFAGVGVALIATGIAEALSRLRQKRLEDGNGTIIDAQ